MPEAKQIILSTNLRGVFFEDLNDLNNKSLCPIPQSIIYYSSDVLGKFALSENFFDVEEGKVREKILGTKLLEATQLSREEQKKIYKEVADMSLLTCGYFAESVQNKLVDVHYYSQLGKMAYSHLNNVTPRFLDIPNFYGMVTTCFEQLTMLMTMMAAKNRTGNDKEAIFQKILRDEIVSEKELLVCGVFKQESKKVS